MQSPLLVLDVNYLCHRGFYAMPFMENDGIPTMVTYAVLRDIIDLQETHMTKRICFTFDYGKSLRREIYPLYKQKKGSYFQSVSQKNLVHLRQQISLLRDEQLDVLGFKNIFYQDGYEADDVIASICKHLPDSDTAIIVSADHDLYQLLAPNIMLWDIRNKKMYTQEHLKAQFGISPSEWSMVKAMAGCTSDNIRGITGVGETNAAKYITGRLSEKCKGYKNILRSQQLIERNLKLVTLPYPGTDKFELQPDKVNKQRWRRMFTSLGMDSLVERI